MMTTESQQINPRLSAAISYASLGWHILPCWWALENGKCACGNDECKNVGKHPIAAMAPWGQNSATTKVETLKAWWDRYPKANLAAHLIKSKLCALDIDPRNGGWATIEAIEAKHGPLTSDLLQFTGGGGEHRLFELPGNLQLPGKLGPGVDVKINGYIMLEPSNHKSGKTYEWEASSDPRDGIIASPLPDWLRDIGHAQQGGSSTEPSGQQRTISIPESTRNDIVQALHSIDSDDRDTWLQVGMALHSTGEWDWAFRLWDSWSSPSAKYDPRDQLRVWRSFKSRGIEGVTYKTIFAMARQEGVVVTPQVAAAFEEANVQVELGAFDLPEHVDGEELQGLKEEMPVVDNHLLTPPGVMRDVVDWINATAPKPQPLFAVQAAIAFTSTVLGRRFRTQNRNWSSLFLMNIGQSASGKEYAKTAVEELLQACGLGNLIGPSGYSSDSGVTSGLLHQPNHVAVIDEFHRVLEQASVKSNARARSALTQLMEAWGRQDGTLRPQSYSTVGMSAQDARALRDRMVVNPSVTLMTMAIPDLWEQIGSAAVRDGFLNRFLIVESEVGPQVFKFKNPVPVPQSVIDWAQRIRSHYTDLLVDPDSTITGVGAPVAVGISSAAQKVFEGFDHECLIGSLAEVANAAGVREFVGRGNEIAMRLAMDVALGCDSMVIEASHAQWAVEYVHCHLKRGLFRLKSTVADGDFEASCKQVLAFLRRTGEPEALSTITKHCRRLRGMDLDRRAKILATLVADGAVSVINKSPESGKGKKTQFFMAIEVVDQVFDDGGDE